MREIDTIIVHQTDTKTATVESIRRYHKRVLKWKDIGYHYVIYRNGSIHKGRINSDIGSHCRGDNATSIGICLVGKGPALPIGMSGGYMTIEQWKSLVKLCSEVMIVYKVPLGRVFGHRERPSGQEQGKTCPGFEVALLRKILREAGFA